MLTQIEIVTNINNALKEIFEFIQTNKEINSDFEEYIKTVAAGNIPINQVEKVFLPYVFERRIGENSESIIEKFLNTKTSKFQDIIKAFTNAQYSIFEIKKVLKNGFELLNLINEKVYNIIPLTKMTNFRGIYSGQFIVARIFEYEGQYYIIEIANVLSHSQATEAMRYAVMRLVQAPELLYLDNPEKENEIKATINDMYSKFIKTFNKDIILTTNKHADEIIGAFNEDSEIDLSDKGSNIKNYKFFHVKELDNNYNNFLENSVGGFSSHQEVYDVAVLFDKDHGLYAIPFYETFTKIFENKDEVENAKDCVNYFLTNDSIPITVLDKISAQYPNFMQTINEILETNYTYEDLLKTYKSTYLKNKLYSSATVLFCSKAFSQIFDVITEPQSEKPQITQKIGRNEPCPCGSGKKFKNCCGKE